MGPNVVALIIRKGLWGIYYTIIITLRAQNPILIIKAPTISLAALRLGCPGTQGGRLQGFRVLRVYPEAQTRSKAFLSMIFVPKSLKQNIRDLRALRLGLQGLRLKAKGLA